MKEDIQNWCKENNHLLVDLNRNDIAISHLFKLAQQSVLCTEPITKRTRQQEYVFARLLVIDYLASVAHMTPYMIAGILGVDRTTAHYWAEKRIARNLKYYSEWQQEAYKFFTQKTEEIRKKLQTND